MKRETMMRATMTVACTVLLTSALPAAQDDEPSYSIEGAWLGWATIEGLPQPFPFMDLYSSDSNNARRSGAVLCTLITGPIPGPAGGLVSATPSSHGNWVRVAKNKFAFTAWKILLNEAGQAVGTAKFRGVLTATSDTLLGTVDAAFYYGESRTPFATFKATTASQRVDIENDAQ